MLEETGYTYDGNDNLLTRVTPKAETISFAYNAVNELLTKTLPGSLVTSYVYDLVGNLTSVTDPDSALTMTYAGESGADHQHGRQFESTIRQRDYTYDNRLTLADAQNTTTYAYDVLNRLTSLTAPVGGFTFAYDGLSRQTSLTLPNGTSIG